MYDRFRIVNGEVLAEENQRNIVFGNQFGIKFLGDNTLRMSDNVLSKVGRHEYLNKSGYQKQLLDSILQKKAVTTPIEFLNERQQYMLEIANILSDNLQLEYKTYLNLGYDRKDSMKFAKEEVVKIKERLMRLLKIKFPDEYVSMAEQQISINNNYN